MRRWAIFIYATSHQTDILHKRFQGWPLYMQRDDLLVCISFLKLNDGTIFTACTRKKKKKSWIGELNVLQLLLTLKKDKQIIS